MIAWARRHWKILVIVGVAVLLRLLHLSEWLASAPHQILVADAQWYDRTAQRIASGDLLAGERSFFFGPLYAYFLGFFYALFGSHRWLILTVQAAMGVANVVMVHICGRRLHSNAAGIVAATVLALYAPSLYYEGFLLMESLITTLLLLSLTLFTGRRPRRELLRFGLVGALLGLAATGRPTMVLVAVAFGAWEFLARSKETARARLRPLLALVIGAGLLVAVPTARNLMVEGDLVVISSSGGFNLYSGNGPYANGTTANLPWLSEQDIAGAQQFAQQRTGRVMSSSEVSRYWLSQTWDHVSKNPGAAMGLLWRKLSMFLDATELPQIEWYEFDRAQFRVLAWPLLGFGVLWPVAGLGLVMCLRRRDMCLLMILFGVYVIPMCFFFINARYRIALIPVLCILAGGALVQLTRSLRERRLVSVVSGLIVVAGLAIASNASWLRLDRDHLMSTQHVRQAYRYSELGDVDRARRELAEALRLRPTNARAHYSLGLVHREEKDYAASEKSLRLAMVSEAGNPEYPYGLAITLYKSGDAASALRYVEKAMELSPYDPRFCEYEGLVRASLGQEAAADEAFRRSLELGPARAQAHANYGVFLGSKGRHGEAMARFRRAVALDPDYTMARRNLALSAMGLGDVETAREQARWLLDQDPEDTLARQILDFGGRGN